MNIRLTDPKILFNKEYTKRCEFDAPSFNIAEGFYEKLTKDQMLELMRRYKGHEGQTLFSSLPKLLDYWNVSISEFVEFFHHSIKSGHNIDMFFFRSPKEDIFSILNEKYKLHDILNYLEVS
jgi:hypothetical protein